MEYFSLQLERLTGCSERGGNILVAGWQVKCSQQDRNVLIKYLQCGFQCVDILVWCHYSGFYHPDGSALLKVSQ